MTSNLSFNFNQNPSILEGLNSRQKEAIKHKNGPLLIIAGAGTGKTSVITRRIAYIIEQKWAKPEEILALTFTEKAAAEMEERVDKLIPYGYAQTQISTFHAFGDSMLREFALEAGLPLNFKLLSSTEQLIFIHQNLYEFDLKHYRPVASPASHIKLLLNHFSRLKDELISPEQYYKYVIEQKGKSGEDSQEEYEKLLEISRAYSKYVELMIKNGYLDYGDQIYYSYQLLNSNNKILKLVRNRFKYILVDEYQDTNYAQNELVKLIAGENGNITVVGDDDQSIYRFRGASISNILMFKKHFLNVKQIVLNINYRSTKEILGHSYKLIQHNNPDRLEINNHINKELITEKHGPNPEFIFCDNLSAEADSVTQKIIELTKQQKLKFSDFAILLRANNHAEPFIQSLNVSGIPHLFSGASTLLKQAEIRIYISFFRLLLNPDDNISFFHLATGEIYNYSGDKISRIYAQSKIHNRSPEELITNDGEFSEIITDLKKYREQLLQKTSGELLYDYLTEKGLLKKWLKQSDAYSELKIFHTASFFDRISNFEQSSKDLSLPAFMNALELIIEAGDDEISSEIDRDINAVNIITAHASKGLEYEVVFVVNMVSDRFPSRKKSEGIKIPDELIKERLPQGDYHIQEERRLFYVAVTRAKKYLFITAGQNYGGKRLKKVSLFALEFFDKPNLIKTPIRLTSLEKICRFQKNTTSEKEIPAKLNRVKFIKLSRQQIDDYFTCPKKYYLAHIIKIPLLENQYLMYGTAIHNALNLFFNQKMHHEVTPLEDLLKNYEQNFKNIGFISREHETDRYESGIKALSRFYQIEKKDERIPSGVETQFEFGIDGIKINGRYDLIYGDDDTVEICDFKTSQVKSQADADKRIKKSTQMQIYALSWYEKHHKIPLTTLYFIESGLKGSITFSHKDLDKTKNMITAVVDGIANQDFKATPTPSDCQYCPYNQICPESLT